MTPDDVLRVLNECDGNRTQAAERLGISRSSLRDRLHVLARKGYSIPPSPQGQQVLKEQSILTRPDGSVIQRWDKTRLERMDREQGEYVPDPKLITKVSTFTDGEGKIIAQWASEKRDEQEREVLWRAFARGLLEELTPIPEITRPVMNSEQWLIGIPIGDLHVGMHAWAQETGADWDLKIAETLIINAIERIMSLAHNCSSCLIASLGDFFHYDSYTAETPQHKHRLDADSRFPKMIRTGMRILRRVLNSAANRFHNVHFIMEPGNHDPVATMIITEALSCLYENIPHVTIDTSPMNVHYFKFGKTLIGTHHGDRIKPEQLPGVMSHDRPKDWGETEFRTWWTGHIHSRKVFDLPGCMVESFQILASRDAFLHQMGYRANRSLQGIVYHKELGEVERYTVSPQMFEG
jgi:hypothetical protein